MPEDLQVKIRTIVEDMLMLLHEYGFSVEVQRDSAEMAEPHDDIRRTIGEIYRHTVGGHPLPPQTDRKALVDICRKIRDGEADEKQAFSVLDHVHQIMIATPKTSWISAPTSTCPPDPKTFLSNKAQRIWNHIKDLDSRPTYDHLQSALQMGRGTINNALKELEDKGYIERTK